MRPHLGIRGTGGFWLEWRGDRVDWWRPGAWRPLSIRRRWPRESWWGTWKVTRL